MKEKREPPIRLGLFIDETRGKGRRLLQGIREQLVAWPEARPELLPHSVDISESTNLSRFDAILAEFDSYEEAKPFWELSIPIINLSNGIPTKRFPKSIMDETAVGKMAADHLIDRGYDTFVCVTHFHSDYEHPAAIGRANAFRGHLQSRGVACSFLPQAYGKSGEDMLRSVLQLMKPGTGLFCWYDRAAYWTIRIALAAGRQIPDELGIVGANNDSLILGICPVPLTSIDLPWEKSGTEAVRMVREWLNGKRPEDSICSELSLVERNSTQRHPVNDVVLSKCLTLIEQNLSGDLGLPALARHAGVSERLLYKRFHAHLHTTPARYVLERRLKLAKRLLLETDLTVYEVAEACGFEDSNYFAVAFKRETSCTPSAFRKVGRKSGPPSRDS